MGLPIVKVASGGLPVTIATTGGVPCTEATNGIGVAVTQSTSGGGLAVTGFTFGPTIQLSANSVLETAAVNTTVGTLSVSAGTTGTPTFTMVTGGSTFNILGTALRTSVLLDFETTAFYSITVAVSGVSPTVANQTFTIIVVDVAEPVIILTGTVVTENSTAGTNIGVLSLANSFTGTPAYTLVDSSSGKVAISGANLNVLGAIDFETTPTFNITVSVSGIVPAAVNKVFTIVVLDVVESGTVVTWNDADMGAGLTLSGDKLKVIGPGGSFNKSVRATASQTTGKYFCTFTVNQASDYDPAGLTPGFCTSALALTSDYVGGPAKSSGYGSDGHLLAAAAAGGSNTVVPTFTTGDVISMALDLTAKKVWYRKNSGGWNNDILANQDPVAGVGGFATAMATIIDGTSAYFPACTLYTFTAGVGQVTIDASGTGAPSGFTGWGSGAVGTTKNIVTDYGAVGDAQWAQTTLSISTNVLTSATAIWPSSTSGSEYIGKSIVVGKAGSHSAEPGGGSVLRSTITGWTSSTVVTLADSASWPLSSEPNVIVAWGTNNGKQISAGDGVNGSFETFRLAYQGQAVTLTIPSGNYLISSGNFGGLWDGIKNITVNATGATLCGGAFAMLASHQSQWYGHSGYTNSASAGATSVTLRTPAYVSRFTIGTYALMTGFGLQYGGYPSNHQRFEYVFITAIDSDTLSPTYGKITFLSALTNSYLSTWPLYVDEAGTTPPPNNGTFTSGGPATLYALSANFNHTCVVNNLTVAHHPQMGVAGLNMTFNNCVFKGIWGPHATISRSITLNSCTAVDASMEVDKLVTAFTMTGCDWGGLAFQSSSISTFTMDSTSIRFSVVGSPYKTIIRNGSTIGTVSGVGGFTPGPVYGAANELVVTSSQIKNFGATSTHESGYVICGTTTASAGVNADFTKSGGVITIPSSAFPYGYVEQWPVTGQKLFYHDDNIGKIGSFTITDVTQSGGNALVTTNSSGGWPSRTYSSTGLRLVTQPAQICTFTSVTGCPEVVDLSNAGAAGLPLYSYSKRSYTGSIATAEYWQLWGRVKKIVVIVTTAYTGATPSVLASINLQASNVLIKMSDFSNTTWAPVIDLKKTGTRTFDATANTYPVTWSSTAVAAADTLPSQTEALWIPGNYRMTMTDISAESSGTWPAFSIEVITDQG